MQQIKNEDYIVIIGRGEMGTLYNSSDIIKMVFGVNLVDWLVTSSIILGKEIIGYRNIQLLFECKNIII